MLKICTQKASFTLLALCFIGFLPSVVQAAYPIVASVDGGVLSTAAVSTSITLSPDIDTGDLLLVFFVKDGTAAPTSISGTGWAALTGGSGSGMYSIGYWKIATGDDALTINHASVKTAHISYRITGHDPNTAPENAAGVTAVSVSPNPPALNPTNWGTEQTLWITAIGYDPYPVSSGITLSSFPSGYSDSRANTATVGTTAGEMAIAAAARNAYAASEDPGTATLSSSASWIARTYAIRPVATSSVTYSGTLYTDAGNTPAGAGEQVTVVVPDGERFEKLTNPGTLPTGNGIASQFSHNGTYLAVAHEVSPFITIYKRSGDTFTKLANPASLPVGTGRSATFSHDDTYLAVTHNTSPFITIYKRDGDTFTKLPDPSTLPAGLGWMADFSPDGVYLSVVHANSPFLTIYKRDGDTFTKLSDPSTLPPSAAQATAFNSDGSLLCVSNNASPYISIYEREGDVFTKLPDPASLPTDVSYGCSFSPDGKFLAVTQIAFPRMVLYERTGDTFTRLSSPSTLPIGQGERVSFSPDSRHLMASHISSPYITTYRIEGSNFNKIESPATLPTGSARVGNFSSDGNYVAVAHDTSPYITIYKINRQNKTATDTTDSNGDWSVNITLSTTTPSTLVPAMAFVSSGTTSATTIFTDVLSSSVRTSIPLYGDTLLVHGTTSTSSVNRYYYYDSTDNARVLYTATSSELVVNGGFVNATNTTMQIPPGYTLSVSGDVEQRGSLAADNESTWNFNGGAQTVSGNFTGASSFANMQFENIGQKLFTNPASTTDLTVSFDAEPDFTKLANPASLPTGTGWGNAVSGDGRYVMVAHGTTPFVSLYRRSGDTLLKLPTPATIPLGSGLGADLSSDGTYAALAHASGTFLTIYKRSGDTFTKLPNPATLPTGEGRGAAFSADDTYLAIAHATTPFVTIYKRSGDTFTKLANPASLPPNTGNGVSFSPDGTYLVVAHASAPRITIYKRSGDTFTKLADPATAPTGNSNRAAFSPDGNYLAVAHEASPYITVYKRSGDTFTKLTDPTSIVGGNARAVDFSPDGTTIALGHLITPFITLYELRDDTLNRLTGPSSVLPSNGQGMVYSPDGTHLYASHQSSPFISTYKISNEAFTKLPNPSTIASSTSNTADFSDDGTYLSIGYSAAPYLLLYKRSGDTFTKLTDPLTAPTGIANGTSFSPDATYLAVAHNTTPFVTIYKRSGDTFTKLADPATLPTGNGNAVDFSSDGVYLSVAHGTSPYVTIYKRSGDTFTKLSNPATLPSSSAAYGTAFSADTTYLAVAGDVTPFITIYKRSGDTFTKLTNPSSLPPDDSWAVSFSPDTTYVAVTHSTSPYLTIYKRSGDTFTKLTNPAELPNGTSDGLGFSPDGTYLVINHTSSPYITIYKRDGDTFTKIPDPATIPAGRSYGTAFSPDGKHMAIAHASSPRMSIYKTQTVEGFFAEPLTIAGSLTNNALLTSSSTVTFIGTDELITGTPVSTTISNLIIDGTITQETDIYATDVAIDGTLSIERTTLYAAGDVAVTGALEGQSVTAQLNLNGDVAQTVSGDISSSLLDFTIDGTYAKTISADVSIGDLTLGDDLVTSSPVTFTGASVVVNGQFTNNHDLLLLTDTLFDLKLDLVNAGKIFGTSSTMIFSGVKQQYASSSIARNARFGDLTITNTSGFGSSTQSVIFGFPFSADGRFSMVASSSVRLPSATTTSVGNLNLNGESANSPVWLRASTLGSRALIDTNDLVEVAAYVNMRDMNNTSGSDITCYFCTNVANNLNWVFSQSGPAEVDLELSNHTLGQVANVFSTTNVTTAPLYAFNLAATGENVELSGFTLPVTGIRNVDSTKVTNIKLWRDNNSNRVYDAGDSFIDDSTLVVNGRSGTITFDNTVVISGSDDFLITADTVGLTLNTYMNLRLRAENLGGGGILTESPVVTTGSASNRQHIISGSGSGGGRVSQIGTAPPVTDPVGGGGQGNAGGGSGEVADGDNFGDAFDYVAPTATGDVNNQWTNGANALVSDGVRATAAAADLKQSFSGFGYAIPGNSIIEGIGVRLDASGSTAAGTLQVALSWNGGANSTSVIATPVLSGSDVIYTVGGQNNLWGRSWSASEFSNANFRVIVTSQNNNNTVRLDGIEVRVYAVQGGGGGGGGGAI